MSGLWLFCVLAAGDVEVATGLGQYTAFASLGVVGIIGLLCIYMVMYTIPNERRSERDTLEKINKGHDQALAELGRTLHDAVRDNGIMFATTLREYREEQSKRDAAERSSRDSMLRASDEKVDRLASSFQDLALSLGDVMQAMAIPLNHSGVLRRKREHRPRGKDMESVLE